MLDAISKSLKGEQPKMLFDKWYNFDTFMYDFQIRKTINIFGKANKVDAK